MSTYPVVAVNLPLSTWRMTTLWLNSRAYVLTEKGLAKSSAGMVLGLMLVLASSCCFSAGPVTWPWTAEATRPDAYLLDLACARECAQADAVGFGTGEYEFTRWLDEPALVRGDLLADDGPAMGDWGRHGLRLFTITRW